MATTDSASIFSHLNKANSSPEARHTFVLRVYGTLAAQTLATILMVHLIRVLHFSGSMLIFTEGEPVEGTETPLLVLTGWGSFLQAFGAFGSFLVLFLLLQFRRVPNLNVVLLGLFTAAESAMLGLGLIQFSDDLLARAAGTTAALFAGLAAYVIQNKKEDFSWMGQWLFSLLWLLVVQGLISALFGWQPSGVLLYFGAAIFSGFIVYDTWRIHNVYNTSEWVLASLDLYLDLLNLFIYILRIMKRK